MIQENSSDGWEQVKWIVRSAVPENGVIMYFPGNSSISSPHSSLHSRVINTMGNSWFFWYDYYNRQFLEEGECRILIIRINQTIKGFITSSCFIYTEPLCPLWPKLTYRDSLEMMAERSVPLTEPSVLTVPKGRRQATLCWSMWGSPLAG